MEIKINLVISADTALLAALQTLTSGKVISMAAPTENGETKRGRPKKSVEEIPGDAGSIEEKTVANPSAQTEVKTDLTLEIITKVAVPLSKAGHKDKIKAKISELGYESIVELQPVHFEEFHAFLQTLK